MDDTVKLDAVERQLQTLGDAVCDVFEQMVKGNWVDDCGHDVTKNQAMANLANAMERTILMREAVLGYKGGAQFI